MTLAVFSSGTSNSRRKSREEREEPGALYKFGWRCDSRSDPLLLSGSKWLISGERRGGFIALRHRVPTQRHIRSVTDTETGDSP